jgi:hypothetical protein
VDDIFKTGIDITHLLSTFRSLRFQTVWY